MVMNQFYGLTVTYVEASVLIALILEDPHSIIYGISRMRMAKLLALHQH